MTDFDASFTIDKISRILWKMKKFQNRQMPKPLMKMNKSNIDTEFGLKFKKLATNHRPKNYIIR